MIPATLVRTVPAEPSPEADLLWALARELHPTWGHVTYRDPIDPFAFPRTSPYWHLCHNGAQLAGLIRLEALIVHGGFYIDSDVELVRPLDDLRGHRCVAGWEDDYVIPDAVLAAEPAHPAIHECIRLAIARLTGTSGEEPSWQTDQGAWATGPGVTTTVLKGRDDVTLLDREAFYPVWYEPRDTLAQRLTDYQPGPGCYGIHRFAWSWR